MLVNWTKYLDAWADGVASPSGDSFCKEEKHNAAKDAISSLIQFRLTTGDY